MDSFTNILSGMSRYESKLQFVEGEKAQLQQVSLNYLGNFYYNIPYQRLSFPMPFIRK